MRRANNNFPLCTDNCYVNKHTVSRPRLTIDYQYTGNIFSYSEKIFTDLHVKVMVQYSTTP